MSDRWLITKRGLYYRPNAQGYTGLRARAGIYTHEVASAHCSPEDGLGMISFENAPEITPACDPEIANEWLLSELARLRTELEAAKCDAVGVKALEWTEYEDEQGVAFEWDAEAGTFGGFYGVRLEHDGYHLTFWDGTLSGPHDTHIAAQEAAQADFERRIRSALTADKSEAEVRQEEQIREDERDRLYETAANSKDFEALGMLSSRGAMRPEDRARSRAQGGMEKGMRE